MPAGPASGSEADASDSDANQGWVGASWPDHRQAPSGWPLGLARTGLGHAASAVPSTDLGELLDTVSRVYEIHAMAFEDVLVELTQVSACLSVETQT